MPTTTTTQYLATAFPHDQDPERPSQAPRRRPQNLVGNKLLKAPQIAVADAELLQLGDCMKQIGRARTDMPTSTGESMGNLR
jgi:hypothetical protein